MMRSLRAEWQKAKRRHDLLACLLLPLAVLLWAWYAAPDGSDSMASGYHALLYSVPIMNTVLLPIGMAMLASRLWDVEVKGNFPKLLYTLQSRQSLFAAKSLLGAGEIFLIVLLNCWVSFALASAAAIRTHPLPASSCICSSAPARSA